MHAKQILVYPILNSKGEYTLEGAVIFSNNQVVSASIPQGTSTGSNEALTKTVTEAIEIFNNYLKTLLLDSINGRISLQEFHAKLLYIDSTPNKNKIGGNTFLLSELLFVKAAAFLLGMPLYKYLSSTLNIPPKYPNLLFNVINGGVHALNSVPFQEFWIIPKAHNIVETITQGALIYKNLKQILQREGFPTLTGLEGGFSPAFPRGPQQAFEYIVEAIEKSNLTIGVQVELGLDIAANSFTIRNGNQYALQIGLNQLNLEEYTQYLAQLVNQYPITIIEDPLPEFAPAEHWRYLKEQLPGVKIIGDDLTTTNLEITKNMFEAKAIDGLIIKPNQVGSILQAINVTQYAKSHQIITIASHRSGDTNDPFIAEFSYALGTDYLKAGAPAHGERVCKYNQLLRIYYKVLE